jgi:hypothetical protein
MFNKRHNTLSNDRSGAGISGLRSRKGSTKVVSTIIRNNSIEEGMTVFGLWLNVEDKHSTAIPIIMKDFAEGKRVVLQDNILKREIIVDIVEGVPFCTECRSNDCTHVGFAICAEEMKRPQNIE